MISISVSNHDFSSRLSPRPPKTPNGKRGTIFRRALNSKNDMTGASRKIWILIYPHPSDARESQKDTPFLFFLFRRQRVSKGNFISNRENIVRIQPTCKGSRRKKICFAAKVSRTCKVRVNLKSDFSIEPRACHSYC